ncbi:MAG: hypothetical protein ACRDNZ_14525 [Streptosporangiaceae bacterium]
MAGILVVISASLAGRDVGAFLSCVSLALFTAAEMQQSARVRVMAQGLAPPTAQAEYFVTFNLYAVTQNLFGRAVEAGIVTRSGVAGWMMIAVVALAAAMLMPWAATAADRGHGAARGDMAEAAHESYGAHDDCHQDLVS